MKLDPKAFPQGRDEVIAQLKERKIESRPGFYSSNQLPIYKSHSVPVSDDISRNTISLPSYPQLTEEDINFICNEFIKLKR